MIGFTATAFITLVFTILRELCTRQFERKRKAERESASKSIAKHNAAFYRRWGRNLNRVLLGLSDIQSLTAISILIASFSQLSSISLYHLALSNYTAQFAQTSNLVALSYVRGALPDRDMLVRDFLVLSYYTMVTIHTALWYQKVTNEWDALEDNKCYFDKTWWVRDGNASWPLAFTWNGVIFLLYLHLVLKRRKRAVLLLAKSTNNRWAIRYMSWLNKSISSTRWVSIPYDILFRNTGIVLYSLIWVFWNFYDVWFGLFVPNIHQFKKLEIKRDSSDFEWGFGQVLTVNLLASHALMVYQTWSGKDACSYYVVTLN